MWNREKSKYARIKIKISYKIYECCKFWFNEKYVLRVYIRMRLKHKNLMGKRTFVIIIYQLSSSTYLARKIYFIDYLLCYSLNE